MRKTIILLLSLICLVALDSCGPGDGERAQHLLCEARAAYSEGRMNESLTLLDSITSAYPREVEVRRAGMALADSVRLAVNEGILHTTDSLIAQASAVIDSVASLCFVFEKTEYDELGRFLYKGTQASDNDGRSYIRAAVDEYGVTQLISTYCGTAELRHTGLRLSVPSGESVTTAEIPWNDGSNYRYSVNERRYEVVTYVGERDGGALAFAALHAGDPLKAVLIGGAREYPVTLTSRDIQGLAATFELGVLLRDRLRLTQERKTAQLMIEKLLRKKS